MIIRKTASDLEKCGAAECWFTKACMRWVRWSGEGVLDLGSEVAAVKI